MMEATGISIRDGTTGRNNKFNTVLGERKNNATT